MRLLVARLTSLAFFAALLASLTVYPLAGNWLCLVLMLYGGLLLWRPQLWLLALPALLPICDLAPRTGWFFLEEIDLLLMLTVCVTYWQLARPRHELPEWPLLFRCATLLLAIAGLIGLWRGLQPWPLWDVNTFNNYLSSANALRVGKAWLWWLLLLPPLRQAIGAQREGERSYLMPGMMLGLLLVTLAAVRERVQFPGLLNFSSDYRISAPFSAMHTGGAALDGYLALTIPLLAVWLFDRSSTWRRLAALALLPFAWYAGLATFSRGLYLALATALAIVVLPRAIWWPAEHQNSPRADHVLRGMRHHAARALAVATVAVLFLGLLDLAFRVGGYRAFGLALLLAAWCAAIAIRRRAPTALAPALAGLLVLSAAVPIYHGYYLQVRFSSVSNDWSDRLRHWRQAVDMMDQPLLGNGLGTFPAMFYWHNPQRETPPSYQFVDEPANRHLRLSAGEYAAGYGELLRVFQVVGVLPRQHYIAAVDIRNDGPPAFLHLNLCQRQLLYPQSCSAAPLRQIPTAPYWQRYEFPLLAPPGELPVKLDFAAEGQQAVLDVDNLSLRGLTDHHELLRNGDFSNANNYWFFSSDRHHLPWHTKNLFLNLYFDMGWLAVFAYAVLLLSVAVALWQRGDTLWLAALAAFQIVGLFDSLIDVPRITLLSMLLLSAAALPPKGSA